MRERLTTLDWQREMLGEAGMGPAPLPSAVRAGAFARPLGARHARRRARHTQVALPMALDAKLEARLVAICVALMDQAPGFVAEELAEMARHPIATAFFFFAPLLCRWLGPWPLLLLVLWMAWDTGTYVHATITAGPQPPPTLRTDAGPGATPQTLAIGTMLALLASEFVLDAILMAAGSAVGGWF